MLKPLADILQPDRRHVQGGPFADLSDNHLRNFYSNVADLDLHLSASRQIQTQFDTARYSFIYSWFCYELLTLAEQQAYFALENGLRVRIQVAKIESRGKGLDAMIKSACKHGCWIGQSS